MFVLLKRQDYYPGRGGGNEAAFEELTWQGDVPLGLVGLPRREAGWTAASGPGDRGRSEVHSPEEK